MIRTKGEAGTGNVVEAVRYTSSSEYSQMKYFFFLNFVYFIEWYNLRFYLGFSHARAVQREIRKLQTMDDNELYSYAKEIQAPVELVKKTKELGRLPVVNFAAGGIVTITYYHTHSLTHSQFLSLFLSNQVLFHSLNGFSLKATPADAAMMMQLGMDGVFVGSGRRKTSFVCLLLLFFVMFSQRLNRTLT